MQIFSGFASGIKYSTVNSYRRPPLVGGVDRMQKGGRLDPKFILFSHYSDYANADTERLRALENMMAKENFSVELFIIVKFRLSVWTKPRRWKIHIPHYKFKVHFAALYLHISHVCRAVPCPCRASHVMSTAPEKSINEADALCSDYLKWPWGDYWVLIMKIDIELFNVLEQCSSIAHA